MASFNFPSFIIGLLLGMIIMLILVWIAYYTRIFLFTYCPTQMKICSANDYFNNPGDALANGANINDILFLNDKNQMFYKRVPKSSDCVPSSNQTVHVIFPQYCSFSGEGISGATGKAIQYNSPIYDVENEPNAKTLHDCVPVPDIYVNEGIPLLKWDTNPLTV